MTEKLRPALYVAAALLLGSAYVSWCHDPAVRAAALRGAGDRRDDSTVSRLVYEARTAEARFLRARDSTGREIANQRKILDELNVNRKPLTDTVYVQAALAGRDSLISDLTSALVQDSLQIAFWRAQVVARDSLIPRLTAARDAWRKSAERPRYVITDILGGAALGYALAKDNRVAAGVGGVLILLPRAADLIRRMF